jgi:hypothetical protein
VLGDASAKAAAGSDVRAACTDPNGELERAHGRLPVQSHDARGVLVPLLDCIERELGAIALTFALRAWCLGDARPVRAVRRCPDRSAGVRSARDRAPASRRPGATAQRRTIGITAPGA